MRILYHDAVRADAAVERELSATATDLETLLHEADFVTLHTNLTPDTRHLIGERTLRLMRKSAVLVNAARAPIVDDAVPAPALPEPWTAGPALALSAPPP